ARIDRDGEHHLGAVDTDLGQAAGCRQGLAARWQLDEFEGTLNVGRRHRHGGIPNQDRTTETESAHDGRFELGSAIASINHGWQQIRIILPGSAFSSRKSRSSLTL